MKTPFHYRDSRTNGMPEEVFSKVSREDIYAQTGIQILQINTLFQLYSMVKDQSAVLEKADKFLTIPDLLNYWLSGKIFCEFTNATTTQCFNPLKGDWAVDLLDSLNIPSHIFSEDPETGDRFWGRSDLRS